MSVNVTWGTRVITIPIASLTLVSGTQYEYDVNDWRLAMKDKEDDEDGIAFPDMHKNTAPTVLGGVGYARQVEIINGFTVVFEDGQYGVDIINGNTNIMDVLIRNQVSVATQNSAGLVFVVDMDTLIRAQIGNVDVTLEGDGSQTIEILEDDAVTVRHTQTLSADERTKRTV